MIESAKNNIPRSIANRLGALYVSTLNEEIFDQPTSKVSNWIKQQNIDAWNEVRPTNSQLSGEDYRRIWMKLNGLS